MSITDHQLHLLHHALGLTPEHRTSHRNHFVAGIGHHDQPDLEALEAAGLMARARTPRFCDPSDIVFQCTDAGRALALERLPPPPKYSRYDEYRRSEYSESFAEWLDIEVPRREFGGFYGVHKGMYRISTSKASGDWHPTVKAAKASYKAALAKARAPRHTSATATSTAAA
jgi:hypothetical protein